MDTAELALPLRRHGLRLTPQRLVVLRVVRAAARTHPTAEEIFRRARAELPTISLATVYKVLNELVGLGELRRVELGEGGARFDANTAGHAHLLCRRCGHVADLAPGEYEVALPVDRGYRILDQAVLFYGLCPACRAAEDGEPRSRKGHD